ncbi:MAG TPA: ABC transporter substrate-binding protein, partial [Anaerolineae bacterium]|nr:ABC transporter substrate-binding protein [Anaerolineae bacterium]
VRQALAMAIDRKRIVDNFCAPGSLVAEEYIPPSIKPGADDLKWYTYDKDAAKKALADAGFPNGFDMELSYRDVVRPYLPSPSKVAQDLQAQLKEIGVNVKLNVMESGAFLDAADAGNLPMFLLGWFADFAGPTNFYDTHFSAGIKDFGKSFDDITTEMNAAAKLSDPAERQMHYSKINQLLKQHVPLIPIMHCNSSVAFKANVQGAHSSPFGDEEFAQMSNGTDQLVFVQNAEPIALWCADEDDGETFRACVQLYDPLLKFSIGGTDIVPGIAEKYSANPDATEWTFNLRQNAKFSDGSELNANDVVATLTAIWDAKNPNHKGRTGNWNYMQTYFGHCLNAQPTTCTP